LYEFLVSSVLLVQIIWSFTI